MKTITSHWFSMIWTMLVLATSVLTSFFTLDPSYVARAGALITLSGIFMTTRRTLVNSVEENDDADSLQEEIEHVKAEKCGFWFLIFGTLIWAYGDLTFIIIKDLTLVVA